MEIAAGNVGLHLNAKKTEMITYNQPIAEIKSLSNEKIKNVEDFKYLGSWIDNTQKYIKFRIAQGLVACNKLNKIWKSNLNRNLKERLFVTTVESVLLYGCESWALNNKTNRWGLHKTSEIGIKGSDHSDFFEFAMYKVRVSA